MLEVPPIVPRDKSSIRDATGSTPDTARGEIDGNEALFEEEDGQAQAAAALKKRKRVKKSPVRASPPKKKDQSQFFKRRISGR